MDYYTDESRIGVGAQIVVDINITNEIIKKGEFSFSDTYWKYFVNNFFAGNQGEYVIFKYHYSDGDIVDTYDRQTYGNDRQAINERISFLEALSVSDGALRYNEDILNTGSLGVVKLQYIYDITQIELQVLREIERKPSALSLPAHSSPELFNASLWVDYIYLDTEERRDFATKTHDYLIEQVQHTGVEDIKAGETPRIRMDFKHPVKELIWGVWNTSVHDWNMRSFGSQNNIEINGFECFEERDEDYFRLVQPYQHHTRADADNYAYVYSFGLNPELHQPSGACNFSQVDNSYLNLEVLPSLGDSVFEWQGYNYLDTPDGEILGKDGTVVPITKAELLLFAVNYNVIRIDSGMGTLLNSK